MINCLSVLIGGGIGALLRYLATVAIATRYSSRFPLATFLINVSGSLLIGLLMNLFARHVSTHPTWRLLIITGVLGGYTTFSTFEFETLAMAETGAPALALIYAVGSVTAGLIAAWVGSRLASLI